MGRLYSRFTCRACGAETPAGDLARGAWGDPCCPSCGSADVERRITRWQKIYAAFFLFKVY